MKNVYIITTGETESDEWGVIQNYFETEKQAEDFIYSCEPDVKKDIESEKFTTYENEKYWFMITSLELYGSN